MLIKIRVPPTSAKIIEILVSGANLPWNLTHREPKETVGMIFSSNIGGFEGERILQGESFYASQFFVHEEVLTTPYSFLTIRSSC
jgi:hypothetical protein